MHELAKLGGYFISPLTLAFTLWSVAGLCLVVGRRRWAVALAMTAVVGLWIASMPVVATALIEPLEARHPAIAVEATPEADAIVVLGGALAPASPPKRPTINLGASSSRVWHAAALYRAGKAKWLIVAAGNQPDSQELQVEAEAISQMLITLGVPRSAIRLEAGSRNTRENASQIRPVIRALQVRRILLVTSAAHMPRAMESFTREWPSGLQVTPSATDVRAIDTIQSPKVWIPNAAALSNVTSALKEYAGLLVLAIM